jgi:hypothetical protein
VADYCAAAHTRRLAIIMHAMLRDGTAFIAA